MEGYKINNLSRIFIANEDYYNNDDISNFFSSNILFFEESEKDFFPGQFSPIFKDSGENTNKSTKQEIKQEIKPGNLAYSFDNGFDTPKIEINNYLNRKFEKIFKISKVNKKKGRLNKKSKQYLKGKHDKNAEDNITYKIKRRFGESLYNYINFEYGKYLIENNIGQKEKTKLLKRISPEENKKIKKDENLKWFSMKIKDLLSMDISSKYSNYSLDYNKKQIEKLYQKNEAINVIDILNKSVREMYEIYIKDLKLEGFKTLEDDMIIQRKKMEEVGEEYIDEFLEKYKIIAQNLEENFMKKKSRCNKKSRKYN